MLAAAGWWLLPHVQRFLVAHGRLEPNYRGAAIPRGMGIVLWLLIGVQEALAQILLLLLRSADATQFVDLSTKDSWAYIAARQIEVDVRLFAFAATVVFVAGWTDDLIGDKSVKGLKGHFRYCRDAGTLSMGAVKALLISAACFGAQIAANAQIPIWEMGINGLLLLLLTNALNLLDVRPGRALKAFIAGAGCLLLIGGPASAAGAGAGAPYMYALLPVLAGALLLYRQDAGARGMLGDAGSNMLGFTLGYGVVMAAPIPVKLLVVALLLYMHVQAEISSISALIERNRFLNWLDRLGRT